MRLLRPLVLPLSVLVLLIAAVVVPLPVFVERPGSVLSLADTVTVSEGGDLDGDLLLTTVNLRRGTVADVALSAFDDAAELVAAEMIVPAGESTEDYFAGQRTVFSITADVAAAVGLRAAGYDVEPTDVEGDGARVVGVLDGSAAAGVLRPGDVIVRADDEAIETGDDLQEAVVSVGEQPLELTFQRDGERRTAAVTPQTSPETGRPVVGVQIETVNPQITLPVPVEVDSGRIGGPSAGLLIALTVYDKVDTDVDLIDGRRVAGTGTLGSDGQVGPIGSIEQKVVTAARADADVFLAPAAQAAAARAAVPTGSDMEVLAAGTFDQAVDALASSSTATGTGWPAGGAVSMIEVSPRLAPGG